MVTKKTIAVIPAILISTLVSWIVSYVFLAFRAGDLIDNLAADVKIPIRLGAFLLIALVFCAAVYLMLVWDSGDRLPPLVMLFLGVFWYLIFFFFILSQPLIFLISPIRDLSFAPLTHLVNALNIAFGAAGLFTKRKPG